MAGQASGQQQNTNPSQGFMMSAQNSYARSLQMQKFPSQQVMRPDITFPMAPTNPLYHQDVSAYTMLGQSMRSMSCPNPAMVPYQMPHMYLAPYGNLTPVPELNLPMNPAPYLVSASNVASKSHPEQDTYTQLIPNLAECQPVAKPHQDLDTYARIAPMVMKRLPTNVTQGIYTVPPSNTAMSPYPAQHEGLQYMPEQKAASQTHLYTILQRNETTQAYAEVDSKPSSTSVAHNASESKRSVVKNDNTHQYTTLQSYMK